MRKEFKQNVFKEYVSFFYNDEKKAYKDPSLMSWKEVDKEWKLVRTHEELIIKIEVIKEGYMLRNQIKWGANYTFSELIALESWHQRSPNANHAINLKMSWLDRQLLARLKMQVKLPKFIKTARIDDLITAADQNVLSNVAQLVQFIEDSGFEFEFYDNVSRDIVDTSLKDARLH